MRPLILTISALLIQAATARAVVTLHDHEQHGNKPFTYSNGEWQHVAAVLNLPGRVYYRDKGSTGFGVDYHGIYAGYRGDAHALNQALKLFAELPGVEAVVFLPSTGAVLDQKRQRVGCHWRVRLAYVNNYDQRNVPAGQIGERVTGVRLEVFFPELPPKAVAASDTQLNRWIQELDHDTFAQRERAYRALEEQGLAAREALQKALAASPTVEQQRRLEQLLILADRLRLEDVILPRGLHLTSFDHLLNRERPYLADKDPGRQWQGMESLHHAIEGTDDLLPIIASVCEETGLARIRQRLGEAPKDTMQDFMPLLKMEPDTAEARLSRAARFQTLRQRLDALCASTQGRR